jgi:hypothetical protein
MSSGDRSFPFLEDNHPNQPVDYTVRPTVPALSPEELP